MPTLSDRHVQHPAVSFGISDSDDSDHNDNSSGSSDDNDDDDDDDDDDNYIIAGSIMQTCVFECYIDIIL